jgi:glycosyltransferase involved in cell wall biosynthesis
MRVGLVTRYYPPLVRGGSHLSVYYIARGLAERGVDVHVFTSALPENMRDDTDIKNIGIHRIFNYGYSKNIRELDFGSIMMARQLRQWLKYRKMEFDILHSYGMDTIPTVWINRRYGKPVASVNGWWATCPFWDHTSPENEMCVVCSLRKLLKCQLSKRYGQFIKKISSTFYLFTSLNLKKSIMKRLDLLLPISDYVKGILVQNGFDSKKMRVCYSMFDPADYESSNKHFLHDTFDLDQSTKIVLYAGRFARYKGIRYIMKAIPEVLQEHEDLVFLFIGHGAEKEKILNLAKKPKIGHKVILGSFIEPEKMPDAYASSYCVILPSTWPEPFARVPMEALASGTAVVATDVGGIPEIIIDKETGLLIKPFSSSAISEAILTLLMDERMRYNLVETGKEMVLEKHSLHNQVNNYISAYEEIL